MKEAYTVTRKLEFDAGHRLVKHESKCKNLHGHRYTVEVTCVSDYVTRGDLDSVGRVIDFGKIKQLLGTWIDDNLDHTMISNEEDPFLPMYRECNDRPVFVMKCEPTAENLANMLFLKAQEILSPEGIEVCNLDVWETPNCKATYWG